MSLEFSREQKGSNRCSYNISKVYLRKWWSLSFNFFLLFALSKEWCSLETEKKERKENEQAPEQLARKLVLEEQLSPSTYVTRAAFGSPMENPSRAPEKDVANTLFCIRMNTPYIWAENIASSVFPLLLLIVWSTKAWERVTCQTKALWVPWRLNSEDGRNPSGPIISTCTN